MSRALALSPVRAPTSKAFLRLPGQKLDQWRLRNAAPPSPKEPKKAALPRTEQPLRVFQKFRAPFSMKKFAPKANYTWNYNVKAQAKEVSEKQLEGNLGNILSLLAYEGCTFEDVRAAAETVFPCVPNLAWLADYICDVHVKPFVCIFEKQILNLISGVTCRGFEGEDGLVVKPFNKHIRAYRRVVETIYQQYKHWENTSLQMERLIKHYLHYTRQPEEALTLGIQKQLFYAWQFNSDVFTLFISNLHNYFQRSTLLPVFASLEETISKVAHIHFGLDQSGLHSAELPDSTTPTRTSMQVLNNSIVKNYESGNEKLKEISVERPIAAKKKRNKKKPKDAQKAKENIDRLFEADLKYLPVRSLQLVREKAEIRFTAEEKMRLAEIFALS